MWNWDYCLDFVRRIEFLRVRPALPNGTNGVGSLFLLACDDGNRASFRTVMVLRSIQDDGQKSKIIVQVKIDTTFFIMSTCFIFSFTARNFPVSFTESKHVLNVKKDEIGTKECG